jgi:nicotinamide riboside kinase
MRVGISGAHSTGKTTVARSLIKEFGFIDYTDFVKRFFIPRYGMPDKSLLSSWRALDEWYNVVVIHEDNLVIDRTPIDHIIYARVFGCSMQIFEDQALHALQLLDVLVVLSPVVYVKDEGHRVFDEETQEKYQAHLIELFKEKLDPRLTWPLVDQFGQYGDINKVQVYLFSPQDLGIITNLLTKFIRLRKGQDEEATTTGRVGRP